jgi:hypothetical protein
MRRRSSAGPSGPDCRRMSLRSVLSPRRICHVFTISTIHGSPCSPVPCGRSPRVVIETHDFPPFRSSDFFSWRLNIGAVFLSMPDTAPWCSPALGHIGTKGGHSHELLQVQRLGTARNRPSARRSRAGPHRFDDVREIASGWLRIATDRGGQTVIRMRAAPRQRRLEGANDPDRLAPPRRPRSRLTAKVFRRR